MLLNFSKTNSFIFLYSVLVSNSDPVWVWIYQFHIVFPACWNFPPLNLSCYQSDFIIKANYFDSAEYYLFVSVVHDVSTRVKYSPPIYTDNPMMTIKWKASKISPSPYSPHRIMMTLIKPHSPRVSHHPFLNVPTFENSSHSTGLIIYAQTLSGGHHKWTAGTSPAKGVWKGLIRATTNRA